jgi:hypothetical protein
LTFPESETFGPKQGVNQVGAEPDGDQQTDDGITHGRLLEPVAERSVGTHQSEAAQAESEEDEVEHAAAPPSSCGGGQSAPGRHKVSIGKSARANKDGVKIGMAAIF